MSAGITRHRRRGRPVRPTHPHEAMGTDRSFLAPAPCHRTELGRKLLSPGPVVDERCRRPGRIPPSSAIPQLPKQHGEPAVCLTLANAASVLDHVNSVRPARSFTRTLHHAGHLSPGDLWRALDGEYPRTAILVRRHHDVITLTDQYGDSFAYPTAAAVPTAVPDALESGSGGRPDRHREPEPAGRFSGVREDVLRPAITRAAMPGRASVSPAPPNVTGRASSSPNGAAPAPGRGGFGSRARPSVR